MDFDRINQDYPVDIVLRKLGIRVTHNAFKCPFHEDGEESGSLFKGRDGRLRWRCHACDISGDSIDLIMRHQGLHSPREAAEWITGGVIPNGHEPRPNGHIKRAKPKPPDFGYFPPDEHAKLVPGLKTPGMIKLDGETVGSVLPVLVHRYSDGKGVRLVVVRWQRGEKKIFMPVRWSPTRKFVATSWQDGEERLFYREADLAKFPEKTVLVVEGEKCVDILHGLEAFTDEYVILTWAGGSATAKYQPWEKLKGRRILFWPDADLPEKASEFGKSEIAMRKAGFLAGAQVMQIVIPLQRWVDLNPNPKGFDAADLLESGMPAHEARALMESLAETLEFEPPPGEPPPRPDPPPPPEGDGIEWVRKPVTRGDGIEWVFDPRDESNLWLWISQLSPNAYPGLRGGYKGRLSRDVFTQEVLLDGKPLDEGYGVRMITHHIARDERLRSVTNDKVRLAVGEAADMTKVNPLADELRALEWDGTHRYLLEHAGVDITPGSWGRVAGWRWLLGLVKRILDPGCIHDGVLVLEGPQGAQKTSFFRTVGTILGRDLFVEVDKLVRDPDMLMILQGKAVVELAEMAAQNRGDRNAVKSMLSTTSDKYRRPYGRKPEDVKRTCVFGGTTNDRKYLRDPTGNRRYWIVRVVGGMRLDALAGELPQLLAQAVHYLTHPEPPYSQNWLTPDEERMQEGIAKERQIDWPQFDKLDQYLDRLAPGTDIETYVIWENLGYTSTPPQSPDLKAQLTMLMEERGWEYGQFHRYSGTSPERHNRRSWKKPDITDP